jgi:hypothetical protein
MRVRDGRVQRKNRTARSPNCLTDETPSLVVARQKPGYGYRHVASQADVRKFLSLLPTWQELTAGLNTIVLAAGSNSAMGWYRPGVVAICAWEWDVSWDDCRPEFFKEHNRLFEKLGVPTSEVDSRIKVDFTRNTARAFLLVHVLVHELGHHHDRITTRSKVRCGRGELYAEAYARKYEDVVLARYRDEFEL